jgi:uncharacterized membrane protein YfcA
MAAAIFLLAGTVKGVVGFGLPTVCLALFALTTGLFEAMALLLWPSLVTNLMQALQGGNLLALLTRLRALLIPGFLFIFLGGMALGTGDPALLSILLGLLIVTYAGITLSGFKPSWQRRHDGPAAFVTGALNGILTGMTGSFVVPGVLYLNAIGLPRDQLVQAMGILFTLSTVGLGIALGGQGLISSELSWLSIAGVVPAMIGMSVGRRLRHRLAEQTFRRVFLLALLVLGGFIILRAAVG